MKHNPDYKKNKTADIIPLGKSRAVPQDYWQINLNLTPEGNSFGGNAFLPRSGKNRPTTHVKINECDH